jgi:cobalt/nickel transport protein
MKTRAFLVAGAVVVLLLAGFGSFYASSSPDGLETVAGRHGISDSEKPSAATDSPLAGYRTAGVEDDRLSGGLAGVAGSLVVLALAGGLFWVLRRGSGRSTGERTEA